MKLTMPPGAKVHIALLFIVFIGAPSNRVVGFVGIKGERFGMQTQGKTKGFIVGFAGLVHPAKGSILAPSLESVIFEAGKLPASVFTRVLK